MPNMKIGFLLKKLGEVFNYFTKVSLNKFFNIKIVA